MIHSDCSGDVEAIWVTMQGCLLYGKIGTAQGAILISCLFFGGAYKTCTPLLFHLQPQFLSSFNTDCIS